MSYSRDFKDFSKGIVRPADMKRAISFLKNAKGGEFEQILYDKDLFNTR
jgi:hypothetical protein